MIVLHVIDRNRLSGPEDCMVGYLADKVVNEATRELGQHGVPANRIRVLFKYGQEVKRILETMEEERADLVITGSRRLSDLAGAIDGSVSHRAAHLASCNVITVEQPRAGTGSVPAASGRGIQSLTGEDGVATFRNLEAGA